MFSIKKEKKQKEEKAVQAANAVMSGGIAVETAGKTAAYNNECNTYRTVLKEKATAYQTDLNEKLKVNPNYVGDRSKGVDLSNKYEKADVKMGGRGSAEWNKSERAEIIKTGKVRGAQGHHIDNVASHPEKQTDPNNIKHFKDIKSHLQEGHGGNFRNPSSGDMIDKDKMLQNTNTKRVIKNEFGGVATAASVGALSGVGRSVFETCKEEGLSVKSVKKGLKESAKPAAKGAAIATASYAVTRVVSYAFNRFLKCL